MSKKHSDIEREKVIRAIKDSLERETKHKKLKVK